MREFILSNDKYGMNWVAGKVEWGTVRTPDGITAAVTSERDGDVVRERYVFTNTTDKDIFTSLGDIAIYTPFNDDYCAGSDVCAVSRCHTHIWCGGDISYVMALRMGAEPPHLGLVLTEGSLGGYSVERDLSKISNDRGDFLLHPSPAALAPGESFAVAWTLFPHGGKDDFYSCSSEYSGRFIDVKADNYVVFKGETIRIEITPRFDFSAANVTVNGTPAEAVNENGRLIVSETAERLGEHTYDIEVDGIKTHCAVLVLPEPWELAGTRCRFIPEKQQYHNAASRLDGAYLTYDNEEKHIFYSKEYDLNGGRERVGMGILMARYLRTHNDAELMESLKKYAAYVDANLLCRETGEVFNDYKYDDSYERLYNYPWVSLFCLELYELLGDRSRLETAYRIMTAFYERGGAHFYAIEIPMVSLVRALEDCGMTEESERIKERFREHADVIAAAGLSYPAHEVNYEQSIAAPAADILLSAYIITGEDRYLDAARVQISALDAFNGEQPDYHLYETAIRHWDGYWFGKRRLYGDTFPHYWSALSGSVFERYADITGDERYRRKAESSFRSVLSLIKPDGTASCAYVYPVTVNGVRAGYYDPYANDQDWGMYFMLRHLMSGRDNK